MGTEAHERVTVELPRRRAWWRRWRWRLARRARPGYWQCPACDQWRTDPTECCWRCGL